MELKSPTSSVFLHAGKHLGLSPNQIPHSVPLLLTGNTGEVIDHCTSGDCDYEEIVTEGENSKKYKLVNNQDGNEEIELESTTEEDATAEAFEALGWSLVAYKDES